MAFDTKSAAISAAIHYTNPLDDYNISVLLLCLKESMSMILETKKNSFVWDCVLFTQDLNQLES